MGRCGVGPGKPLVELCRKVAELPGLAFRGIMTYQGFVSGSPKERERQLREEDERLAGMVEALAKAGLACKVVSGASTPNLFLSHLLTRANENRCGTYVFNDRNTVASGSVGWDDCAARVAVTVVSTAVPGQIIVDGGSKTFTSDPWAGGAGFGRVAEDPEALFVKMNEEHGYVKLAPSSPPHRIGDRLHIIPNHICVTTNMHERLWIHEEGKVVDCWEVAARGKLQ
jgi:D-serine deaminase-like pyridoxal phosphate-dependent protein